MGRWSEWKAVGSYGTVGLEVVLSVMVGMFGGRWLDSKAGTAPWLMLLGLAFGIGAAVKAIIRVHRQMQDETARDGWKESDMDRLDRPGRRRPERRAAEPVGSVSAAAVEPARRRRKRKGRRSQP